MNSAITGVISYSPKLNVYVYILYYMYRRVVKPGFFKGGGSPDCHVDIHGMFYLKESLQRGVMGTKDPPPAMAF